MRRAIDLDPEGVTIYQTEISHNTQLYCDLKTGTLLAASVSWAIKRPRLDEGFQRTLTDFGT